jgi:asparagine synthase (glutamine-hydrolysing)
VEARYPFLDREFVSFATRVPPALKFDGLTEKIALRAAAAGVVPPEILRRRKFPFSMPGTPALLRRQIDWIDELLSPARIRRDGYFEPVAVERLRKQYVAQDFHLSVSSDQDWLLLVITLGMWLDEFRMPQLH